MACIRGVKGVVKWSYYHAAAIEGYTVTPTPDGRWSLTATVIMADGFKMKQRPLVFVAPHNKGSWCWPIEDFNLEAGRLTAQLGPPIE